MSRDHRKLKAFELADELVLAVYRATQTFPRDEMYGLTSQMRRAAVSVPSNIVEGCARRTEREYIQQLSIAFGSLRELGYQITLAQRLGYLPDETHEPLAESYEQAARTLGALIRSLTNRNEASAPKPRASSPRSNV